MKRIYSREDWCGLAVFIFAMPEHAGTQRRRPLEKGRDRKAKDRGENGPGHLPVKGEPGDVILKVGAVLVEAACGAP